MIPDENISFARTVPYGLEGVMSYICIRDRDKGC